MALSPEDKTELQAMMLETVGGLVQSLQLHLDQQIIELQADVDMALDKLDSIEIDVKDMRAQVAKVSRERFKDVRQVESSRAREVSSLTEIQTLRFQINKLTERLDRLEKGSVT